MLRISGVYAIKNTVNGKLYVGSSTNIISRWRNHRWELRTNKHSNSKLQRAWNKYGESSFRLVFLDLCHPTCRVAREQEFLDELKCCELGYNLQPQAGQILITDMGRQKMAQAKTQYFLDPVHRQKQAEHLRALHSDADIVKRRSEACKRTHASGRVSGQADICKAANSAFHERIRSNPDARAAWIANISAARRK